MKYVFEYSREELNRWQYPIIVENWDRIASKEAYGRLKRLYVAEYTSSERATLARYYKLFYRWYFVTGTPEHYIFRKAETMHLILRAIQFFATI